MSDRNSRENKAQRRRERLARTVKKGAAVPGDGSVYQTAFGVCSAVLRLRGRASLAREVEADGIADEDIAGAYAAGMQADHRPEAYKGAMAALQEHQATNGA